MIFDSISIENFGAYAGTQSATLTPRSGRPIILLGGMNGGGKTTMLDAIQLAFYGPRARISNRGGAAYRDYLRDSIHRNANPSVGASITVKFRRMLDGTYRDFELKRSWSLAAKGVEERLVVASDGTIDDDLTGRWEEVIDAYLPSSIAHLFFFDGEQIKDLAESSHASEILRTAIESLLGLDLVARLDIDLKVFERKKRTETLDNDAAAAYSKQQSEIDDLDRELGSLLQDQGAANNKLIALRDTVARRQKEFAAEGGELFVKRVELEEELASCRAELERCKRSLRDLAAGALPLVLMSEQWGAVEEVVDRDNAIQSARKTSAVLEERDESILSALKAMKFPGDATRILRKLLNEDRRTRSATSGGSLVIDASEDLKSTILLLRKQVLPAVASAAIEHLALARQLQGDVDRIMGDLARVPPAERVARLQEELQSARQMMSEGENDALSIRHRIQLLSKRLDEARARLGRFGEVERNQLRAADDQTRMLTHSSRVRGTLERFRAHVVGHHISKLESLILDSFGQLIGKARLVSALKIDPNTFEITLRGAGGELLPFERLSAGERQLLATSLLWGLARASGRPIPTIIDTPLGRLDSTHREHLLRRYFPNASHQVILLSTDEEISGRQLPAIDRFVARRYLLEHDSDKGSTRIVEGYFK